MSVTDSCNITERWDTDRKEFKCRDLEWRERMDKHLNEAAVWSECKLSFTWDAVYFKRANNYKGEGEIMFRDWGWDL